MTDGTWFQKQVPGNEAIPAGWLANDLLMANEFVCVVKSHAYKKNILYNISSIYTKYHQIALWQQVNTGDVILKYPEQCFLTQWIELQVVGPKTIGWKKVLCCWCWGRVKRWGRKNDKVSRYMNKLNMLPWLRESSNKLIDMLRGNWFMFSVLSAWNYNEHTPYIYTSITCHWSIHPCYVVLLTNNTKNWTAVLQSVRNPPGCGHLPPRWKFAPVPRRWVSGFYQFLGENIWQR